jgi:hypothetical protein
MIKKLLLLAVCVVVVAALVPSYVGATSGGIDAFYEYWWGYWIYLSDATCDAIVYAMGAGVGISGIIASRLPPAAPIAGIVAGVLTIGGVTIGYLNRNDTGIKIRLNYTFLPFPFPPMIPTWVGAQPDACGTVTGQVTSQATGDALPYSTVTATQSGQVIVSVGTDSNGRYAIALSPGTYIVKASYSGYYEIGQSVTVSDGVSTTLKFQLPQIIEGGGGGCPFLQVWDGSDYVDEGLLNIHNADGVDVTYEHVLTTVPEPVNGAYEFRLVEHPQTISDIDQVQLHAVLEDGTVRKLHLMSAWHSEHGNVLNLLLKSDDRRVEEIGADHNGGTSQSIDLTFTALGSDAKAVGFILTIEGYNPFYKT